MPFELGPEALFDALTWPVVACDGPTAIRARRGAGLTLMLLRAKTAIAAANAGSSTGIIAGNPWLPNATYMYTGSE
jgi:hypothetical protein